MLLQETISMMTSPDYKERFIAEYAQLSVRMEGLLSVIDGYRAGTLDFTPSCSLSLLEKQYLSMGHYRSILQERAIIEDIHLPMFALDFPDAM